MADSKLCTDTETKGSDEILELFCEECLKEGNKVEVCAYCSDCDEYFCTLCQKYHAKFLKDHKILDGENVPKDVERCPLHKQIIKLYCSTCEKFACCMCTTHSSLPSVEKPCKLTPLAELSKDIKQSEELTNGIAKLDKIVSTAEIMQQNESKLENIAHQAKRDVQKYKDKILAKVEQMNSEIDKKKQTDSAKLNALGIKIEELSKKFQQRHGNAKSQRIQTFIVMKHMKSEIESLDKEIDEITAEMDQLNYIFEPDTSIIYVTEENQTFGTLMTESETTEIDEVQMMTRKIAVHQYDILNEDNDFHVRSFCVLPGQVLAICDSKDNSVKLFNASQKSVIATRKFNTTPKAITYVGNRQFAVAQYSRKNETASTITFIIWSANDTLYYEGKHFKVEAECLDIIHVPGKQRLIVLLRNETYNESKVQILDMSGTVLETYGTNPSTNTELFSRQSWITFDNKSNILYATNLHFDELITIHLDMEKDHEDKIKCSFLQAPNGIACDSQGFIYASLHGNNKIMYYNPETPEFQDVLTEKDNIFAPKILKYCEEDNLLYVSDYYNIKVFKIIEKQCVWKETIQKVWEWEPISTSELA